MTTTITVQIKGKPVTMTRSAALTLYLSLLDALNGSMERTNKLPSIHRMKPVNENHCNSMKTDTV
jgi:hypothetical protein